MAKIRVRQLKPDEGKKNNSASKPLSIDYIPDNKLTFEQLAERTSRDKRELEKALAINYSQLNIKHYISCMRTLVDKKSKISVAIWVTVCTLFGILGIFTTLSYKDIDKMNLLFFITLILLGVGFAIYFLIFLTYKAAKDNYKNHIKKYGQDFKIHYRFFSNQLRLVCPDGTSQKVRYEKIRKIKKFKDFVVFVVDKDNALMILNDGFTKSNIEEVLSYVEKNIDINKKL